jgi:hypothetical protein
MVYVQDFLRVRLEGQLGGGLERFSFGLNLVAPQATVAPDEISQAFADDIAAWFTGTSNISQAARLETLKVNLIGPNGKYVLPSTVRYDWTAPLPQPSSQSNFPFQVAVAVTFAAGSMRGRASKGRMYIPTPAGGVEAPANGIPDAYVSSYLLAARALADICEEHCPGWAHGLVSNLGSGAQSIVTEYRCGRVYDTIRSRRASLSEEYESIPRSA